MKTEKKCPRCGQVKPLEEFGSNKSKPDGHQDYCRVCQTEISREQYQRKKAKRLAEINEKVESVKRMAEGIKKEEKPNLVSIPTTDLVEALKGRGLSVLVNPTARDLMKKLYDLGYTGTLRYTIIKEVSLASINE